MGVWEWGLNLSPWYSSPWVRFNWFRCWWLGAVAGVGVGDTSKIASKWKHHSPFIREEMFPNQLGSHLGSLETVPGPLRSASSPCSATKHTPPFAPPSPPSTRRSVFLLRQPEKICSKHHRPSGSNASAQPGTRLQAGKDFITPSPDDPSSMGSTPISKSLKKTCSSDRYTHLIADTQFHN